LKYSFFRIWQNKLVLVKVRNQNYIQKNWNCQRLRNRHAAACQRGTISCETAVRVVWPSKSGSQFLDWQANREASLRRDTNENQRFTSMPRGRPKGSLNKKKREAYGKTPVRQSVRQTTLFSSPSKSIHTDETKPSIVTAPGSGPSLASTMEKDANPAVEKTQNEEPELPFGPPVVSMDEFLKYFQIGKESALHQSKDTEQLKRYYFETVLHPFSRYRHSSKSATGIDPRSSTGKYF
jgi:hypothetical protein